MDKHVSGEELPSTPIDVDSLTADERMKLGHMIGVWRRDRQITAQALANAADVDRKTLRTIENGTRAAHPAKLRAILEELGVPQVGDVDRLYGEQTRAFIASTAPIFENLPDDAKGEAQQDVVALLGAKLARLTATNVVQLRPSVAAPVEDDPTIDEPSIKQPPARQRTAARKGTRKADEIPFAE